MRTGREWGEREGGGCLRIKVEEGVVQWTPTSEDKNLAEIPLKKVEEGELFWKFVKESTCTFQAFILRN